MKGKLNSEKRKHSLEGGILLRLSVVLVAVLVPLATKAEESSVAMQFLCITQNPATAAIGGISLNDNAASTAFVSGSGEAGLSYQKWNPNPSSFISAGGNALIAKRFGIKAAISRQGESKYSTIDEQGHETGTFKPSALKAALGFSSSFGEHFAAGIDLGYATRKLSSEHNYSALTVDAAFMGHFNSLSFAAGVKAIGPKIKSADGTASFKLPSSLFLSGGYLFSFVKNDLSLLAEGEYFLAGKAGASAGIDYCWNRLLSARVGYHFGGIIPNHAAFGIGVNIQGLHIDFTYLAGNDTISGSILFGTKFCF